MRRNACATSFVIKACQFVYADGDARTWHDTNPAELADSHLDSIRQPRLRQLRTVVSRRIVLAAFIKPLAESHSCP